MFCLIMGQYLLDVPIVEGFWHHISHGLGVGLLIGMGYYWCVYDRRKS